MFRPWEEEEENRIRDAMKNAFFNLLFKNEAEHVSTNFSPIKYDFFFMIFFAEHGAKWYQMAKKEMISSSKRTLCHFHMHQNR